jgi:hypothetical protein
MIFKFKDLDREIAAVDLEGVSGSVSGTVMDIAHQEIEVITYNTPISIKVPFENQTDLFHEFLRLCVALESYKENISSKEEAFWATIERAGGTQH